MAIRFTNTTDDFLAANMYHFDHSPTARKQLANYRWAGALTMALTILLGSLTVRTIPAKMFLAIAAVVVPAIFAYFAPVLWKRSVRRQTLKLYNEGSNKALLSEKELEATPDGLVCRSAYGESKTAWGAIERIEATAEHTFLYIGALSVVVIPNTRIPSSDLHAFLTALQTYYQPDQVLPQTVPVPRPAVEPQQQPLGISNASSPTVKSDRWYIDQR